MNLLLIFISIFHKTLKKPCLCDSDIYFLFGRFRFQTAIASKPFFPPTFLACTLFSFFVVLFFSLSLLYSEQLSADIRNCGRLSRVLFFGQGAFLTRRRERNGLFCIMITADCIFPPFCYSSYVKKIRSFLTFDTVVSQWAMSLSSARIVARILGGRSSRPPLGRLIGHSLAFFSPPDRRTRAHTSPHPLPPSLSLLSFFPSRAGLENFSQR